MSMDEIEFQELANKTRKSTQISIMIYAAHVKKTGCINHTLVIDERGEIERFMCNDCGHDFVKEFKAFWGE